jgi:ABC-type Mn2+/Zn2+ transport system ATPase subunit
MGDLILEFVDVSLGYQSRPVLEGVSLTIERGEYLALVGPNGAGKTTLLRGLLGLIPTIRGRIERHFHRQSNPPGYVPQRDALDPIFPLSAREVVLMGTYARLRPLRLMPTRLKRLAAECLDRVGMAGAANRPFWALSGGQKQRVLIARALAVEPEMMVLDEPTAGVDREAEDAIIDLITRLNREQGLTVVMVTHHLERIRSVVQSVVWVDDGKAMKAAAGDFSPPGAPATGVEPKAGAGCTTSTKP